MATSNSSTHPHLANDGSITIHTSSPLESNQFFIHRLPLELLIRIIKTLRDGRIPRSELDLYDEPTGLTVRHRFIKNFAETSEYFNSVVTPLLYDRIIFDRERVPSTTLRKRLDLLPAVREIVFSYGAKPWGENEYPDIDVLLQLRNVHTIILRHNPLTPTLVQLIRNNKSLRHLALAETSNKGEEEDLHWEDYEEDDDEGLNATENLSFDKDSLQDPSALSRHTELKELTIYAGNSDAPPRVAHGEFTQFFASSIKKLAVNTNMAQFLIPMIDSNRLSLENIVDLTIYVQPLPLRAANAFLIPFFSRLPNVEALCVLEENYPQQWGTHPTVSDTLLPKLKKLSGRWEYSKPFLLGGRRPIEWLEIEGTYNYDIEQIPAHLELRTLFLSRIVWEADCIKKLGARFPTLESVTLYTNQDGTAPVQTWVNSPNVVDDMVTLPQLKKFRLIVTNFKQSGQAASLSDYPPARVNQERAILEAVKANSCSDLVEVRLSEGCHWWFDREDGWKHELVYENHTAFELGRFFHHRLMTKHRLIGRRYPGKLAALDSPSSI